MIQNRAFTSFFVLFGAGVVGSFFGLFTGDVLDAQERMLQDRIVKVAIGMENLLFKTAGNLRAFQREQLDIIMSAGR